MISIGTALRMAVSYAAVASIPYSTSFLNVDVAVPAACGVPASPTVVWKNGTCVYRKVTLHSSVLTHEHMLTTSDGMTLIVQHGTIVTQTSQSGFTVRTIGLLFIAVCMWLPTVINLLLSRKRA